MKPSRALLWPLLVTLGAIATGCLAVEPSPAEAAKNAPAKPTPPAKPPAEAELRAAIAKSLGFLAREGNQWMADKNCNSCHHMPELLWSHREAKRRGFAIDDKKFDEWRSWAVDRATDKRPGLEEAALMILALPERPAPELVQLLVSEQKPDGSWKPAGQFADMQKRGPADAGANTLRLNLLALATAGAQAPGTKAASANAAALLEKKMTPTSAESLMFRALYAEAIGNPQEADAVRQQILKQQRGDGGWSCFIGENMSDPLATGQMLYALRQSSSDPNTTAAIARAQRWLLKTQHPDGSWPTDITHISKIDRSAPDKQSSMKNATEIYHYWGTSWATIGLLQSVPVKQP